MLRATEVYKVSFERRRVIVCIIEAYDPDYGLLECRGYGETEAAALDEANTALQEAIEQPESVFDADEPTDDENDLEHLTAM